MYHLRGGLFKASAVERERIELSAQRGISSCVDAIDTPRHVSHDGALRLNSEIGCVAKRHGTARRRAKEAHSGKMGAQCFVCGEAIDFALRDPHPMAPTVEHIVPKYLGGGNAKANTSVSHSSCNNARLAFDDCGSNYARTMWRRWAEFTQVAHYIPLPFGRIRRAVSRPSLPSPSSPDD